MSSIDSLSVVVPSYNGGAQLSDCLRSIVSQSTSMDVEVVVVDDGSTDGSVERAKASYPAITVVSTQHLGCDGARQAGMDAAGGRVIANTDADCIVADTWLQGIAEGLEAGAAAVTGPVIHQRDLLSSLVAVTDFPEFQSFTAKLIRNFPGCNFAVKRESLQRHGYKIRQLNCGADRVLAWRLSRDGSRIAYDPRVAVYHYPSVRALGMLKRHRRYAVTAMSIRRLDKSLPGGLLAPLGRMAAPAYCGARWVRDLQTLGLLVRQRRASYRLIPALLWWVSILRAFDLAFMLHGGSREVTG
ncbi:MAG: glycosyltransferase [Armatimonadota bacterium]|nr:glycosyltransferase [Armatimonadota bacterium]